MSEPAVDGIDEPLRVLIADDHPPTRAGIRQALEAGGMTVCAEVGSGKAAVEVALAERPDVCLLDIHMPSDGIAAAARICGELPDTVVVMLTVSRNDGDLFAALRAGAAGYLLKDIDPARLPLALRGVMNGEAALPRTLTTRLLDEFRGRKRRRVFPPKSPGVELTSREWEVLELMRDGHATAEIADKLHVAPVTVRTHISGILRKLKVPDRDAAIALVSER